MATYTFEEFMKLGGATKPDQIKSVNSEQVPTQDAPKKQGSISQAFSSGVGQIKEGYNQAKYAKNPLQLLEGGVKEAAGVANAAFSPLAPIFKPIGKAVDYVGDKISENPQVQKFANSPAGLATNRAVEDVANLNTVVGTVAGFKAGSGKLGGPIKRSSNVIDDIPPGGGGGATGKVAGLVDKVPENIMQRVARISKAKQAKFEATAGESVGKYLTKRGIFGNVDEISTKLYDRFSKSKNTADEALATLKGTFDPAPVKTALSELLGRESRVSTPGAPSPILGRVEQLYAKLNREGLTMAEINEVKRLFESSVKLDYLKQNLPESVARANNIDDAIRNWQFKQAETLGLKNLPQINRETRLARQLLNDIGQEYAGSAGNNAFSLTDYILLAGGDPTAIATFLTKKTLSSKGVQSFIAKKLNKGKETVGDVKADLGTSQIPQLSSPKTGSPNKQINVPIKQPSRKAIQQGTEVVPRRKK